MIRADAVWMAVQPLDMRLGTQAALARVVGVLGAAHLRSHVASLSAGSSHLNDAMADFLFANEHQSALFESKASFTLQDNDPTSIKSVLKRALVSQIDPWMGYLTPAPNNRDVVYSCLRESAWKHSVRPARPSKQLATTVKDGAISLQPVALAPNGSFWRDCRAGQCHKTRRHNYLPLPKTTDSRSRSAGGYCDGEMPCISSDRAFCTPCVESASPLSYPMRTTTRSCEGTMTTTCPPAPSM